MRIAKDKKNGILYLMDRNEIIHLANIMMLLNMFAPFAASLNEQKVPNL